MQPNPNEYQQISNENTPNYPPPQINIQPNPQADLIDKPIPSADPNANINANVNANVNINANAQPFINGQAMPVQQPMFQPQAQGVYQPAVQPLFSANAVVGQPQPLLQGGIVVNQGQPIFQMQAINVNPVSMACPFCKNQITTVVERQFNCAACCVCFILGVCYFVMQAVRGKDLCCDDATHRCPYCNNIVGSYVCL
jgi:hypothetical protein